MVFNILILTVFIAEVIIFLYLILSLLKTNKTIKETNEFIEQANPKIAEIAKIGTKISEQLKELAPVAEKNLKNRILDLGIKNIEGTLITLLLVAIKKKFNLKILP